MVVANPRDATEKQRELVELENATGQSSLNRLRITVLQASERSIITLPEAPLGDLIVISQPSQRYLR